MGSLVSPAPSLHVIQDPLEGSLLIVAGGRAHVWRVLRHKPGQLGPYAYEHDLVTAGMRYAGQLWPDFIPRELRGWQQCQVIPASAFKPVDLLFVLHGAHREDYLLWQAALPPEQRFSYINEGLRGALASKWLLWQRADLIEGQRAIATARLPE